MDVQTLNNSEFSYFMNPFELMDRIEKRFDEKQAISWMSDHWTWSFVFCAIYIVLVFGGQRIMKNRKPFDLRRELCMWSTGLSVFSFYAIYKITPLAHRMVYLGGWQHSVCDMRSYVGSYGGGIWAFLFPLSKLPELVDTAFIVLRKQKMVFLHWYHHITVFVYCWYSYAFPISSGIWFGVINFAVHGVMYAYYAVRASGRRPPKWVAQCVTSIQLSQMFGGIFLNYMAIKAIVENTQCNITLFKIGISIFFYVSYAILFGNFFYWTYIHKRGPKKETTIAESTSKMTPKVNGVSKTIQNGHVTSMTNGIPNAKTTVESGNKLLPDTRYNLRSRKN